MLFTFLWWCDRAVYATAPCVFRDIKTKLLPCPKQRDMGLNSGKVLSNQLCCFFPCFVHHCDLCCCWGWVGLSITYNINRVVVFWQTLHIKRERARFIKHRSLFAYAEESLRCLHGDIFAKIHERFTRKTSHWAYDLKKPPYCELLLKKVSIQQRNSLMKKSF